MGLKRQELVDGCFAKAAADEPLFVLRAQDKLIIRQWVKAVRALGSKKAVAAEALASEMEAWQREHGCKVPD